MARSRPKATWLAAALAVGGAAAWPKAPPPARTTPRAETRPAPAETAFLAAGTSPAPIGHDDPAARPELPEDHLAQPSWTPVYRGPFGPTLALTFDDGPHPVHTPRILATLRRHRAKATFFVVGEQARRYPDLVRRILAEGHVLGNHSYSHPSFRSLWRSEIRDEILRTQAEIDVVAGVWPRFLRPPYGRFAPSALTLFEELGVRPVLWSIDSGDWNPGASPIRSPLRTWVQPGAIILFHDALPQTATVVSEFLSTIKEAGFQPVTVAELLGEAPYRGDEARFTAEPRRFSEDDTRAAE